MIAFWTLVLVLLLSAAAFAAEPVRVALIDTGISTAAIDPSHILPGQNYALPGEDTEDILGHGTALASILVGSETAKIAGVCPEVQLVPLVWQTETPSGETVSGGVSATVQAIYDAIDIYGCKIINLSAGTRKYSYELQQAVAYAEEKGVLLVTSAGNDGDDSIYYPAAFDSVLCVGACDEDKNIAAFSQQNDTIDVLVQGTNMYVATVSGKRTYTEGTSFAAAVVTAAAAVLWMQEPTQTPDALRSALMRYTNEIGGWAVLDLPAIIALNDTAQLPPDNAASEEPEKEETFATPRRNFFNADGFRAPALRAPAHSVTFRANTVTTRARVVAFLWCIPVCRNLLLLTALIGK